MDTVALVENQIDEGRLLLDRLDESGFVVRAACWVKPFDEDRWRLCIATPAYDNEGPLGAYRRLNSVIRTLGDGWLTSFSISLVGADHPIVPYCLDVLRRYPHRMPIGAPRPLPSNFSMEEVYVYPLGKGKVAIYGMAFPGVPGGPLFLSFEPVERSSTLAIDRTEYAAETGKVWEVETPPDSALERSEFGPTAFAWNLHGQRVQSSANEVWSLAKLGLHGFRFLRKPGDGASGR